MSQVNYKSTRLLVEAVNREMEIVRKAAMGNMALGSLNELRDLVAELAEKATRTAVEDVPELVPAEYVATMKPLVATYHRLLMNADQLAPCLCMDLKVAACVVILVGDEKSSVKTAHDPSRPEAALVVETLLASLDGGTKRVAVEAETVNLMGGAWEVYRCDQADPDQACGIRRVGPPDPGGCDFVVRDTNRDECCHDMRLADAEHIVGAHNNLVADDLAAVKVKTSDDGLVTMTTTTLTTDRLAEIEALCKRVTLGPRRWGDPADALLVATCRIIIPELLAEIRRLRADLDPCGSEDCYVLASIRRNARIDEDEV